jgi:4-hydroxymandelate oxidase
MLDIVSLDGLELRAQARLDPTTFDYVAGGADGECTLRQNRAAWERFELLPRMLRGVADRCLARDVLGTRVSFPVLVSPMAFHGLCHTDGELGTARAVAAAGTIFIASTLSNHDIESIATAAGVPHRCWFQLYVYRDRGLTRALVERATAAGCGAICLTIDTPLAGNRERDRRNRFRLPETLALGNLPAAHSALHASASSASSVSTYIGAHLDPSLTWADVEWVRSITPLPVVLKGVLHPGDARLAVEHGAGAVIVSNHGGRQLDGTPSPIVVLERVVAAVAGRAEVLLDGGVRRGTDVLKALALGARAVLVGRPVLWGLTLGGSDGVREVLEHLRGELDLAMALAGTRTLDEIARDLVLGG